MYADRLTLREDLPVGVDGHDRPGGGVQGVYAQVRRASGVGTLPDELYVLDHVTIAGASHSKGAFDHVAGGVAHNRHINIVELTQADKLLLAAQELDTLLITKGHAPLHLDELLGGHGEGHNGTRKLGQDLRHLEPRNGPQHHPNLGVMAAGVGGPSLGVGAGVLGNQQRVHLPNDRHFGAGSSTPLDLPFDPGKGQTVAIGNPPKVELPGHQARGLGLREARLRVF